jgi:hypothetical protein
MGKRREKREERRVSVGANPGIVRRIGHLRFKI